MNGGAILGHCGGVSGGQQASKSRPPASKAINSRVGVCVAGAWKVYMVEVTARVRRGAERGFWGADKL